MYSHGGRTASTFAIVAWAALLIATALYMSFHDLAVALTVAGVGLALALTVAGLSVIARSRRQGD